VQTTFLCSVSCCHRSKDLRLLVPLCVVYPVAFTIHSRSSCCVHSFTCSLLISYFRYVWIAQSILRYNRRPKSEKYIGQTLCLLSLSLCNTVPIIYQLYSQSFGPFHWAAGGSQPWRVRLEPYNPRLSPPLSHRSVVSIAGSSPIK
jgi:hypothetical protein